MSTAALRVSVRLPSSRPPTEWPRFALAPSTLAYDADVDWFAIVGQLRATARAFLTQSEFGALPNYQQPPSRVDAERPWKVYSEATPGDRRDDLVVNLPSRGYGGLLVRGPLPTWWLAQDEPCACHQDRWHVRYTRIVVVAP